MTSSLETTPAEPLGSYSFQAHRPRFRVGDWVEVLSKEEILRTLDSSGQYDGMPFMPEMFAFCGKRFKVYKRAHKTCDTVFPVRGRRVANAVHLETRCDGQAHGGCQATCLIFWKEAWLKPATSDTLEKVGNQVPGSESCGSTEYNVYASAQRVDADGTISYHCQATQLPYASTQLEWWDIRQYVEDYRSGNVGFWRMLCGFVYSAYFAVSHAGIGLGRPMRWLYDRLRPLWGGSVFPRHSGVIPEGQPTPAHTLNLQPGELVRIKAHTEILETINTNNQNKGMSWDAEMVPYCGGTYRVLKRVSKLINERTGRMQEMKTPGIILDSVICQARYSNCRLFCPRGIYPYWREIWLERTSQPQSCPHQTQHPGATTIEVPPFVDGK